MRGGEGCGGRGVVEGVWWKGWRRGEGCGVELLGC